LSAAAPILIAVFVLLVAIPIVRVTFYASWYKYLVKSNLDALVVVYSIAYVALRCYLLDADFCSVLSVGLYARSLFLKMAA